LLPPNWASPPLCDRTSRTAVSSTTVAKALTALSGHRRGAGGCRRVFEPYLLGVWSSWPLEGRVGLLTRRAEDVVRVGVPEAGHGPAPSIWWDGCEPARNAAGRSGPAGITMAPPAPPLRPRPAWGRGGRDPHAGLRVWRLLPPPGGWRPALAVTDIPPWRGSGRCVPWGIGRPRSPETSSRSQQAGHGTGLDQAACVGLLGLRQPSKASFDLGRPFGPFASPSPPVLVVAARCAGPSRGCPRPDRRGRPDQHEGGHARARTWDGAGPRPPSSQGRAPVEPHRSTTSGWTTCLRN
jgi:hypothetical protein